MKYIFLSKYVSAFTHKLHQTKCIRKETFYKVNKIKDDPFKLKKCNKHDTLCNIYSKTNMTYSDV